MKSAVIVTAAGSSDRFNHNSERTRKKEFVLIGGNSVLYNSVKPFTEFDHVCCIVVTYKAGTLEQTETAIKDLSDKKEFIFVEGGTTRQKSVFNALLALYENCPDIDYVAIHDGARPFVSKSLVERTFEKAISKNAAVPAIKLNDTLVLKSKSDEIGKPLDRSEILAVQTPQIFKFSNILSAHKKAASENKDYTDDSQVYMAYGQPVYNTEGDIANKKITFEEDL